MTQAIWNENDRQTICHWKGTASYYDIVVDGKINRGAVWQYRDPSPAAGDIKGQLAFGRDVRVDPAPAERAEAATGAPGLLRRLLSGGQS